MKSYIDNLKTITVSVDTSYLSGKAACAYYIKHEKFVVKDSEYLGDCEDNNLAEYYGVLRALRRLNVEKRDREIRTVYITCDNMYTVNRLKSEIETSSGESMEYLSEYTEVIVQHVKGHLPSVAPRLWVNNWCDRESRSCLNRNLN